MYAIFKEIKNIQIKTLKMGHKKKLGIWMNELVK